MNTDPKIAVDPSPKKSRLVYLDHIKAALIVLVVAHHAGQAYGPANDWPILGEERSAILGPFFDVNGSFFMGLFFLISAYFLPSSIDRKGIGSFLTSRFIRLGVPFIVMVIAVFGPITYFVDGIDMPFWTYMFSVYIGQMDFEVGHLWFIALLLFLSVCYAMVRLLFPASPNKEKAIAAPPGHLSLLAFTAALTIVNYVVRLWYPVGEWVEIFPFLPVEMGRAPQYVSFFAAGILAYRFQWLDTISTKTGFVWMLIGMLAAALYYIDSLIGLPAYAVDHRIVLEGFIGVGFVAGLLVVGREFWNKRGNFMACMADNAFAVYLIHIFIVYVLQGVMEEVSIGPFNQFLMVAVFGVILSFVLSHYIRKLPFAKKFL